jgi:hypothetical protein
VGNLGASLAVLLAVLATACDGSAVNPQIRDFCSRQPEQVQGVIDSWTANGTIRSIRAIRENELEIVVEDEHWLNSPYEAKVSIGVSGYCRAMNTAGAGKAWVRGRRDGALMASVRNGHYSD